MLDFEKYFRQKNWRKIMAFLLNIFFKLKICQKISNDSLHQYVCGHVFLPVGKNLPF
jgi:hypothetical protein